ncbi:MAG: hypothetical protein KME30_17290 [Iphinoe sp. HA4291-MV1]|jgi:hypothetical protein|nr:hypothetical protein [Iphinoe sp. HA4291-MV1]
MARKTENLIRLSPQAKEDLRHLASVFGLSLSETVEKLIIEKAKEQAK